MLLMQETQTSPQSQQIQKLQSVDVDANFRDKLGLGAEAKDAPSALR